MNILEKYIGIVVAKSTAVTLIALVILLVFFNFVDELDEVGRGEYQIADAFIVAALTVPRYLFELFPVAALLGALIGLGSLASNSEILAMRISGYTLKQILKAITKSGIYMSLIIIAFGELIAPPSEKFAQQMKSEKIAGQVVLKSLYGFWARDGQAFINIRKINTSTQLEDIYIYEFDEKNKLRLSTYAKKAEYKNEKWSLIEIAQSNIFGEKIVTRKLERANWKSILDPGLLSVVVVRPTMLPIWGLSQYIDFMSQNGQSTVEYKVALWLKIANPLAALAMFILAIPFALKNKRGSSVGKNIFIGTIVGIGFFMLTRAMSYTAVVYNLNPGVSAILPTFFIFAVAFFLLKKA